MGMFDFMKDILPSGSTPTINDPFAGIKIPTIEEQELELQTLVSQGELTAEQAQTMLAERSDMNNISTDPAMKKAQMDALLGLQDISGNGGMTTMDKANLSKIQSQEDSAQRGKREAILQNAQARGMGGSGLELMSQMQNQQESATRQSQRDLDVAGMAQQRALDALMQGGSMAGQIQNQDFNQQAAKAQANDAISKFNAQNQNQMSQFNAGQRTDVNKANLSERQRIADANVGTMNQQQAHNKGLGQSNFNNAMARAGGTASVGMANAGNAGKDDHARADGANALLGAGVTAAGMYMGGPAGGAAASELVKKKKGMKQGGLVDGDPSDYDSEQRWLQPGEMVVRKEDVPDMLMKSHTEDGEFDAAGFLDSITGHKYGYSKRKK